MEAPGQMAPISRRNQTPSETSRPNRVVAQPSHWKVGTRSLVQESRALLRFNVPAGTRGVAARHGQDLPLPWPRDGSNIQG
jgi:hypothetical protein